MAREDLDRLRRRLVHGLVALCPTGITAMRKQRYHNVRYEHIFWITETANEDRPERSGDIL
jgi:hypothetical protein